MKMTFLPFEKPIADLEKKIEELRFMQGDSAVDLSEEIARLEKKRDQLMETIYSKLSAWEITQVARHPARPYTADYIQALSPVFTELHGDRHFADDHAIIGGLGQLGRRAVVFIGQQKGRDTKEKLYRNFGMPRPEGYRKALRLMRLAEKFQLPIVSFIDTPGAYPGIDAEERGQSEAIGQNLYALCTVSVPVLSLVIGEGGSGGALAIASADCMLMMQYAVYSVISPEGCAAILWKDAGQAEQAADKLQLTAKHLYNRKLIDRVVAEPLGGAHRVWSETFESVQHVLEEQLSQLVCLPVEQLKQKRYERVMRFGEYDLS